MLTTFIMIEPHYNDLDTFCTFTVSNGMCRASLDIYANEPQLLFLIESLEAKSIDPETQKIDFDPTDECCMNIGFSVKQYGSEKTLIVTMVDSLNDQGPYRAEIHIRLTQDDATDLATELRVWVNNPVCQFIWKQ